MFSETYTFEVESSDGVNLSVNGQTVINQLQAQADSKVTGTIALSAGAKVPISLPVRECLEQRPSSFALESPSQPYQVVPTTQLYPPRRPHERADSATTTATSTSRGRPSRASTRPMDFNWNGGAPVSGSSGNNWSAEWTGQVLTPCTGTYQWCVTGDDGVRLWIDGVEVDNAWWSRVPLSIAAEHRRDGRHAPQRDHGLLPGRRGIGGAAPVEALVHRFRDHSVGGSHPELRPSIPNGLTGTYYSNIDFTGAAISASTPA